MSDTQGGSSNLLDTTDCLEAVGVFRGWKNFLFVILIIGILLLQVCFWLVDLDFISIPPNAGTQMTTEIQLPITIVSGKTVLEVEQEAAEPVQEKIQEPAITIDTPIEEKKVLDSPEPAAVEETVVPEEPAAIEESVESEEPVAPTESNQPIQLAAPTVVPTSGEAEASPAEKEFLFGVTFDQLVWVIHFVDALLILVAVLYCLTMIFSLKVSMLGRLGGINHITRSFFLSLLMLIFILPWQRVFNGVVIGAIFTPDELIKWHAEKTGDMLSMTLYYLRFTGYMVLVLLLLILSQIRSGRWARAILRRLEII